MEKKSLVKKLTGSREALLAVVLIVLFIVITAINPSFLTPKSLMDMLKNNAVTMVMALGMLCVMLVGGIDISIMSTLALSGMSIGMLLKNDVIVKHTAGISHCSGNRYCLRSGGWSCDLQSRCASHHCHNGIYVCVPGNGLPGFQRR